jgi:serine/threonine-protein phosphatase 2A regulatory subunit A
MFLQMLKDEFPDVRLHIISKLELVNQGKQFLLYTPCI